MVLCVRCCPCCCVWYAMCSSNTMLVLDASHWCSTPPCGQRPVWSTCIYTNPSVQGTTVNVHQMDEAYDALTDYHDRVEQFDPACEHTFSYLQARWFPPGGILFGLTSLYLNVYRLHWLPVVLASCWCHRHAGALVLSHGRFDAGAATGFAASCYSAAMSDALLPPRSSRRWPTHLPTVPTMLPTPSDHLLPFTTYTAT